MQLTLEEELRLPYSDLRSHGWYHGPIGRAAAENLLVEDGHFLVRDCLSQPNDFVLSCQHGANGPKLHFIINRVHILPNTLYERVQYQLEDDLFDSVADLVTFYVGNKRPITQRSGAQISRPVIRQKSLGTTLNTVFNATAQPPSAPPPKPDKTYSNSQTNANSSDWLPKQFQKLSLLGLCNNQAGAREGSKQIHHRYLLRPTVDESLGKLSFVATKFANAAEFVANSVSSGTNFSNHHHANETNEVENCSNVDISDNASSSNTANQFQNSAKDGRLLLERIQTEIRGAGVRALARAITLVNIRLLRLDNCDAGKLGNESDLGLGALSGLEILSLPHGAVLCAAIVERVNYLKLLVVASLVFAGDGSELAFTLLAKWIRVALEIKAALGDLLGFQAVMMGLMSSPVTRLKRTWLDLRRENTELAFLFETKLRQEITALAMLPTTDGTCWELKNIAPNTCIPNIYLYANIMHHFVERLEFLCLEKTGSDYGLGALLSQLEGIRALIDHTDRFRKNALCVIDAAPSSSSLEKRFPFIETENLVALFNTSDYIHYDSRDRAKRTAHIMEQLSQNVD